MNDGLRLNVRIGELRLSDPRIAREIELALAAASRGHEIAGTSPAAAAVVARIFAEIDAIKGANDEQ